MLSRRVSAWIAVAVAGLFLTSCAELELASHTAKQVKVPGTSAPKKSSGSYKIGKPYEVRGIWYYPKVDYAYKESGIASWYGPGFHGRKTANGEIYDQFDLTAAHRTLPLPSMVRVTNLGNGRSITVRINDRGPFANNRIIDLSRRSAELLGFRIQGTAKVKVEVLEEESRQLAALAQRGGGTQLAQPSTRVDQVATEPTSLSVKAAPTVSVTGESLSAPDGVPSVAAAQPAPATKAAPAARRTISAPEPDGVVTQTPVIKSNIFVQAGSFVRVANAERLRARLSSLGKTQIATAQVGNEQYFRVRLGPMVSVTEADRLLTTLHGNGFSDARVVVE
ncbi:septal ring lytic transglycosylase RlpA family protein [Pelagibius sp. Alg239-R121]|uniref:septal ring lytic transglycosylase RlpA family protein n=1 Tax=Pelagibius sp. Alg239-R121 TaxID=2993448 RepID=UPI0024A7710F|nr:septal ring lytic transglycosylase RlpA family protein [Pelagibius sp. Alg239-R121]